MAELDSKSKKKLLDWAESSEGKMQKNSFDLTRAPELLALINSSNDPGSMLELAFDLCSNDLRKNEGTFYTPFYVAEKMVRQAFAIWQDKHSSYSDLCNIKILDPSCGAGEFLLASLHV